MKERLMLFIKYVTGGRMKNFAALMGWTPQYLNRITNSGSMGLRPITALLARFPELNARWLILGEGAMLSSPYDTVKNRLRKILELEKYMPVMSAEELTAFTEGCDDFSESTIKAWQQLLNNKQ